MTEQSSDAVDSLAALASADPILSAALSELRGGRGLSDRVADALVTVPVQDALLSEFLIGAAREASGHPLFGLALSLPQYIDVRGVGQEAFDHCIEPGRLTEDERIHVTLRLVRMTRPAAVLWAHSRLTSRLQDAGAYRAFLDAHGDLLLSECPDDVVDFLTQPDRGPGRQRIDALEYVMRHDVGVACLGAQWIRWIRDGWFDRDRPPGGESAYILYVILQERWGDPRFALVDDAARARVRGLLTTESPAALRQSLYHLASMVEAEYRGAASFLDAGVHFARHDLDATTRLVTDRLVEALAALAAMPPDPGPATMSQFRRRHEALMDADRSGVTGLWRER